MNELISVLLNHIVYYGPALGSLATVFVTFLLVKVTVQLVNATNRLANSTDKLVDATEKMKKISSDMKSISDDMEKITEKSYKGQAVTSLFQMYNSINYLFVENEELMNLCNVLSENDEELEKILDDEINIDKNSREKLLWISAILLNIENAAFSLSSLIPEYDEPSTANFLSKILEHKYIRYIICNGDYNSEFVKHCERIYGKEWDI